MNKQSFIKHINDEKNRVFPLLYKDVKIHQFQKDNKNPKISIDIYQSNQCDSYTYHKPISKIL